MSSARWSLAAIVFFLAVFAVLSISATRTKSAGGDERGQAGGAFVQRSHRDSRLTREAPPLFGIWAMLPHRRTDLNPRLDTPEFEAIRDQSAEPWDYFA